MKFYRQRQSSRFWRYGSYLIALIAMMPIVFLFGAWTLPISPHWSHLLQESLSSLILNSILLVFGVTGVSSLLGVGSAWFLTMYDVPGRSWLKYTLVLPMAIPAYVNGFINLGFWDYSGTFYTFWRSIGFDGMLFEIRSIPGAVWILSLALYPYVFVMSRQAFESQGGRLMEAGRSLGLPSYKVFWNLALPMARPWVVGSLTLVCMETLADFGTVSIFGIDTFTTAIYKSWFGFFSPEMAAQLSTFLLTIVFVIFLVDQRYRRGRGYQQSEGQFRTMRFRYRWQKVLVTTLLWSLFAIAFAFPVLQLVMWAGDYISQDGFSLLTITINSSMLGIIAAIVVTFFSLTLIYGYRFFPIKKMYWANSLSVLGYAFPGVVLAVGVYLPLLKLDNLLADFVLSISGYEPGLFLTGGMLVMIIGLSVRFLAVGHANLKAAQERISPRIDEAAANFGVYGYEQFRKIHLPLIWKALLGSMVLVFIDVIKEMPLTLMTRPLGWDTLSVRVFELISEGEWERAALPSLVLVLLGLVPVFLVKKESE